MMDSILRKLGLRGARPFKPSKRETVVLLLGPAYEDDPANLLAEALRDITLPPGIDVYTEIGILLTRERVEEILEATRGKNRIKIFIGHGTDGALLGESYEGCIGVYVDGRQYSKLYDTDLLSSECACLFAFSCSTAKDLGAKFAVGENTYMGFNNLIGYELSNEECSLVWRKIIQLTAEEIIRDGHISDFHEDSLSRLYSDAIDHFQNGPGRKNDSNLEMLICLLTHKKHLKRFGGYA